MSGTAARARGRWLCPLHQQRFARFEVSMGNGYVYASHGCSACVAALRADVRRVRAGLYRDAPWQRTWDYLQALLRPRPGRP